MRLVSFCLRCATKKCLWAQKTAITGGVVTYPLSTCGMFPVFPVFPVAPVGPSGPTKRAEGIWDASFVNPLSSDETHRFCPPLRRGQSEQSKGFAGHPESGLTPEEG